MRVHNAVVLCKCSTPCRDTRTSCLVLRRPQTMMSPHRSFRIISNLPPCWNACSECSAATHKFDLIVSLQTSFSPHTHILKEGQQCHAILYIACGDSSSPSSLPLRLQKNCGRFLTSLDTRLILVRVVECPPKNMAMRGKSRTEQGNLEEENRHTRAPLRSSSLQAGPVSEIQPASYLRE